MGPASGGLVNRMMCGSDLGAATPEPKLCVVQREQLSLIGRHLIC